MATKAAKAAEGTVEIQFTTDVDDSGAAKVTKGRKHRFAEVPNPQFGTAIGTLYLAEPAFERLGRPTSLKMTLAKGE